MPANILESFDLVRRTVPSPGGRLESANPVVREIGHGGEWYCIVHSNLNSLDVDAVIDREMACFRQLVAELRADRGTLLQSPLQEFEWKVFAHDRPADLKERLAKRGFEIGEEEALLAMDLAGNPLLNVPTGVQVRRVDSLAVLADARAVWEAVFEKEFTGTCRQIADQLATGKAVWEHVAFVAYDDGKPVSAARVTFQEQSPFVGLWTGGTLASHRGRGFYQALVAARAQEAWRRGKRYLTVDARPTSLPILLRRGFQRLSTTWPCVWRER